MLLLNSKMASMSLVLLVIGVGELAATPVINWIPMEIGGMQKTVRNVLNVAGKKAFIAANKTKETLETDFETCRTNIELSKKNCDDCVIANCQVPSGEKTFMQNIYDESIGKLTQKISDSKEWSALKGYFNTIDNAIKPLDGFVPWSMGAAGTVGSWATTVGQDFLKFFENLPNTVIKGLENIGKKFIGLFSRRKRSVESVRNDRLRIMEEELKKKDQHTQNCFNTTCLSCKNFVANRTDIIIGAVCGDDLLIRNSSLYTYFDTMRKLKESNDAGYVLTKVEVDPTKGNMLTFTYTVVQVTYKIGTTTETYISSLSLNVFKQETFAENVAMEIWTRFGL